MVRGRWWFRRWDIGEDYEAIIAVAGRDVCRAFCPFGAGIVLLDLYMVSADEIAESGIDDDGAGAQFLLSSELVAVRPSFVRCERHLGSIVAASF